MTPSGPLLVLVLARGSPALPETLRLAAAWAGLDRPVRLVVWDGAAGALDEVAAGDERWLDALAERGVAAETLDARGVRDALCAARSVAACAEGARGTDVLVADDALLSARDLDDASLLHRLVEAGQVVRG